MILFFSQIPQSQFFPLLLSLGFVAVVSVIFSVHPTISQSPYNFNAVQAWPKMWVYSCHCHFSSHCSRLTLVQIMSLLKRGAKFYIFAKPVVMVDHESLTTVRPMMKLKSIEKRSDISKTHHLWMTTTARILIKAFPPTTCWPKMLFALWSCLSLLNPNNRLIHLAILLFSENLISPTHSHRLNVLRRLGSTGPYMKLWRIPLRNNPLKTNSLKTSLKLPWIFWTIMIVTLSPARPLISIAVNPLFFLFFNPMPA